MASVAPLRIRPPCEIDPAHARLGGEGDELRAERIEIAAANAVLLLGEDDDGTALGGLIRQRGKLGCIGEFFHADAGCGNEARSQTVAERDGAGLVQQQHVDVAGGLDRASGRGDDIRLDHAIHAGNADRRQQSADRGRESGTPAVPRAP